MPNLSRSVRALCVVGLLLLSPQLYAQADAFAAAHSTARVIVKLKADSPLLRIQALSTATPAIGRVQALSQRLGVPMSAGGMVAERTQVVVASGLTSAELAQRLAKEVDVEYAVPDGRVRRATAPNDPLYAAGIPGNGPAVGQWYLRAPAASVQSSINIEAAWTVTMGRPDVIVADVDTGVRFEHPDLLAVAAGGKLLPGYDMISDAAIANDGDGRDADASDPGDWVTAAEANDATGPFYQCTTQDPSTGKYVADDSSWHGTQVAGLIAAITGNGIGMAGVGPNLRLLPVRALGKCFGYESDVIAGMRWAAGLDVPGVPANANRARVINLSLGEEGTCSAAYRDAVAEINATGTVIVASAGNSSGHAVGAPGNCSGVIAVAALRHVGTKVGFSNLGPDVAISAPGGNCVNSTGACLYPLLSTTNSGTTTPVGSTYTDSFDITVGTSFSSPLVAGTAALVLALQPTWTPQQVRTALQASARPFPTTDGTSNPAAVPQCKVPQYDAAGNPVDQGECYCTTNTCGAGMLDAGAAALMAKGGTTTVSVVEYYAVALDHYFITSIPSEIQALDQGAFGGAWARTGQGFKAWPSAAVASSSAVPVCRVFLSYTGGSSHFYSGFANECAAASTTPGAPLFLETPNMMYQQLANASGVCPTGTQAVYRVWSNRPDSNHRFTTDIATRDQMIAKGWLLEGSGPGFATMCAPL